MSRASNPATAACTNRHFWRMPGKKKHSLEFALTQRSSCLCGIVHSPEILQQLVRHNYCFTSLSRILFPKPLNIRSGIICGSPSMDIISCTVHCRFSWRLPVDQVQTFFFSLFASWVQCSPIFVLKQIPEMSDPCWQCHSNSKDQWRCLDYHPDFVLS